MLFYKKNNKSINIVDLSIRTKLLLIYILCVLIPIIVFSSMFYSSVMKSAKKEKIILFSQSLDRLGVAIESYAISAIQLSNIIYPDQTMYEFLNKEYVSKKECLEDYTRYLKRAWEKVLPYNTEISTFYIYTTNDTLINSSNVQKIDDTTETAYWYHMYNENNQDRIFINHIDPKLQSETDETKLVSFIRKLNYVNSSKYEHFLKITFKADMFDRLLRTENLAGNIYVVNKDNLIIAQSDKDGDDFSGTEFQSFDEVKTYPGQIILRTQLQAVNGWKVICVIDRGFMASEYRIGRIQIFILIFFVTVFASFIIWLISASLYKRIDILVRHMEKVEKGEYSLISENIKGSDEIGLLIVSMNKMITKIKALIEDVYKAKLEQANIDLLKKQSELNALQCQVNPHFMFNVLETIRIKSYLNNEFETARIVKYMSKIFRKLLLWNEDLIELRDELKFIKEYLEIQQYRYEDELEFDISANEELLDIKIPKMALQTFVDNACEHGFSDSKKLKIIKINIELIEDIVVINIYDNGRGINPDIIENIENIENIHSRGIGIKNVIGRLSLYYKENYNFKINSRAGEFTEIILTFNLGELRRCKYV